MDALAKFVRQNRPATDPLEYDRQIRLLLNWLDTHKIRERAVFEAQEGREYAAMLQFVEDRTARTPEVTGPLFQLLLSARRGSASGGSGASGGRLKLAGNRGIGVSA
jgi:hypothetical protein